MRVTDSGGPVLEGLAEDRDLFAEDLAVRTDVRDDWRTEGDLAHLDADTVAAVEHFAADDTTDSVQAELLAFLDTLGLEEVAAEDADAVAGLLGLGAIRIQDAQTEGAVGAFDGAVEDAVRA